MKFMTLVLALSTLLLSACVTRPTMDYSKVDRACGLKCQMNDQACATRYTFFPLLLAANCNPEVEACVKACPPESAANIINESKNVNAKATERLNELNTLHKNGVINNSEYAVKKQEILKSL